MKNGSLLVIFMALLALSLPCRAQPSAEEPETKPSQLPYTQKSPWVAGAFSIVPGGGQMYNEDYLVGGLALGVEIGLYLAAASYAGLLDPNQANTANFQSVFLLALAGGIHLLCVFDATMEATRRNENLAHWSVALTPGAESFQVGYRFWF